jgi:hypothetical protein
MVEAILDIATSLLLEYYTPLQALFGTLMFSAATYYSYNIIKNFEEHEDYSLTMFYLSERGSHSFWIIGFSTILFSIGMTLGNLGTIYDDAQLVTFGLLSSFVLFLGIGFFAANLSDVTSKGKNETVEK